MRELGLIALLALVLGQGALLIHDVTAEHSATEVCDICAGLDRPAMATAVVTATFGPFIALLILGPILGLGSGRTIRSQWSRGPPTP